MQDSLKAALVKGQKAAQDVAAYTRRNVMSMDVQEFGVVFTVGEATAAGVAYLAWDAETREVTEHRTSHAAYGMLG